MSYILDALKKSERERKQGAVPDVLTVQEDVQKARGKRPLWPIIVAMALLLNLVLFGWLFAPWKIGSGRNAPAVLPADPEQQGGILPETSPASSIEEQLPSRTTARDMQTSSPKWPAAADNELHARPPRETVLQADIQPEPAPPARQPEKTAKAADQQAAQPPEEAPAALPPAEDRIYRLKELPEQLKKTLPDFTITAFLYAATPSSRMVQINGQMLREGEDLSPGLKLEEITPDGVIMSSRSYRFSIDVQ